MKLRLFGVLREICIYSLHCVNNNDNRNNNDDHDHDDKSSALISILASCIFIP